MNGASTSYRPLRKLHHHVTRLQGEHVQNFERARGRMVTIAVLFGLCYMAIVLRLFMLMGPGIINPEIHAETRGAAAAPQFALERAKIYDRNGVLLASSLAAPSLYADPKKVADAAALAAEIQTVLPDTDIEDLTKKLSRKGRFVWIARQLTPRQKAAIMDIGDPALNFKTEYRRVYPHDHLFSHALGYTNIDGQGIAGLENALNTDLKATDAPINLTLDLYIQDRLREALMTQITKFEAIGGSGLVMDVNTGAIVAMVSLPDFDAHKPASASDVEKFDRNTVGVYEMGSTFKIFSTAAALEHGTTTVNSTYDVREPIKIGRFRIRDFKPKKRDLTLPEVFVHSSNIGTAHMAMELGEEKLQEFYRDLGLFDRMDIDFPARSRPMVPRPWGDVHTMTTSYGHGIAVTPLHVARAVAAIVNGGTRVKPHFVKQDKKDLQAAPEINVVSPRTSQLMSALMALGVETGTGSNATSDKIWVGGKTGTAEKISQSGGYEDDKLLSSFVGVFPADDPKYVVLATIDEPKGQSHSFGYATGGWTAAPVIGDIVNYMLPAERRRHDAKKPLFPALEALRPYVKDDK